VLEPRSNTMKMGVHKDTLVASWQQADEVLVYEPEGLEWSLASRAKESETPTQCFNNVDAIVQQLSHVAASGDHILIMSNGGFDGIHQRVLNMLNEVAP
jgi:UDP-N-acetylmuramate: L-alanyl-gamma-D-glutamyl-meso-diaminopimelate ligase